MRGLQWWLNIKTLSDMRCQKAVNFVHFVSHSIQYFSLCGINAGNLEGPCPLRKPIKAHDLLSLAQGHYQPYSATVSLWLTTASLHGGWMPETSRSLYYWQPAPRWRLLPWLENPGNPAKSPQARKGKLPGWWGTTSNNTASSRSKHTKDCFKQRAHGIPTHAHMQKLLTTRECWCSLLLTLLNCSKLHLIKKQLLPFINEFDKPPHTGTFSCLRSHPLSLLCLHISSHVECRLCIAPEIHVTQNLTNNYEETPELDKPKIC